MPICLRARSGGESGARVRGEPARQTKRPRAGGVRGGGGYTARDGDVER